jgi:hypothetical protein
MPRRRLEVVGRGGRCVAGRGGAQGLALPAFAVSGRPECLVAGGAAWARRARPDRRRASQPSDSTCRPSPVLLAKLRLGHVIPVASGNHQRQRTRPQDTQRVAGSVTRPGPHSQMIRTCPREREAGGDEGVAKARRGAKHDLRPTEFPSRRHTAPVPDRRPFALALLLRQGG